MNLQQSIIDELTENSNKISPAFINNLIAQSTILYLRPTQNMRLCIITLPTGHEVLGKAQVLDASNDVEQIGNQVALDNAKNDIWALVGSIAKLHV
jgi:hypothetical protein